MNYDKIVQDVIEELRSSPIDMLGIGDAEGEYIYLCTHKDSYVRTVRDVDALYKKDRNSRNILEIGSFLGPVSISLKRMGYNLFATDIPEFYESSSLRSLYEKNGIPFSGLNLKIANLPFESNFFDVIIICEVLEHLNFNPLPVLKDMNRIMKINGNIYIGMPNQTKLLNRIKLLLGKSIRNPIDDFFRQLNRNDNMVAGLHWREYTLGETIELLDPLGFEVFTKYFFAEKAPSRSISKTLLEKIAYLYPPFRPYQVVIGRKTMIPTFDFWLTDANS